MLYDILRLVSFILSSELFRYFFVIFLTEICFFFIWVLSHGGRW